MTWALLALPALVVGFLSGLWTYAHVFAHFRVRMEDEAKRRMAAFEIADKRREERMRLMAEQVKRAYGAASPEHSQVIEEEVEAVLSAGPTGGKRAR